LLITQNFAEIEKKGWKKKDQERNIQKKKRFKDTSRLREKYRKDIDYHFSLFALFMGQQKKRVADRQTDGQTKRQTNG